MLLCLKPSGFIRRLFCVSLMILLILPLAACAGAPKVSEAPVLLEPVQAASGLTQVMRGDLFNADYLNASVVPYTEKLYLERDGIVREMPVQTGDYVKAGDVLLVLDQQELEKQVAKAEAELAFTREQYAFAEDQAYISLRKVEVTLANLRSNGGSESAIQQAGAAWEVANNHWKQLQETHELLLRQQEEALDVLRERLDKNQIIAPFDGRVADMPCAIGQWVDAYQTLVVLSDEARMIIQGPTYSNTLLKTAVRLEAQIGQTSLPVTYLAYDDGEYTRKMIKNEVLLSRFTLTNPGDTLTYGEGVTLCIYKAMEFDTLYLPSAAIHKDEVGSFVYRLEEGKREKIYITAGFSNATYTQILEGLEEGDEVYETQ